MNLTQILKEKEIRRKYLEKCKQILTAPIFDLKKGAKRAGVRKFIANCLGITTAPQNQNLITEMLKRLNLIKIKKQGVYYYKLAQYYRNNTGRPKKSKK